MELRNTMFKFGTITEVHRTGPHRFPNNTLLKILDEQGHEYECRGTKAYDAIVRKDRPVDIDDDIHFFAMRKPRQSCTFYMINWWPDFVLLGSRSL